MKRCPSCTLLTNVNPASTEGICSHCGIIFQIVKNSTCYQGIQLVYVPEKKKCTLCGEEKTIDEFYNHKNSSDRHSSFCKKCTNEKHKIHARKRRDERIPDLSKRTLSAVLPHLICISRKGYYADKILNDSLAKIKETISETSSASN